VSLIQICGDPCFGIWPSWRTLRTTDYSYHSRTFRTIAEQWRDHETRRRSRQAIDSPYGLMNRRHLIDRWTDGR